MKEKKGTGVESLSIAKSTYHQVKNARVALLNGELINLLIGFASRKTSILNLDRLSQSMSFLVVIFNDKMPGETIDCLYSLFNEMCAFPDSKVVVVNSASDDNSVEKIAAAISTNNWHQWVELMPMKRNDKFTLKDNAVIRSMLESAAVCPSVLLLKPSCVVRPGALQALIDLMAIRSDGKTVSQRPQQFAFRFPGVLSDLNFGLRLSVMSKLLLQWAGIPSRTGSPCQTDFIARADMVMAAFDRVSYKLLVMRHGRVARYTLPVAKETGT